MMMEIPSRVLACVKVGKSYIEHLCNSETKRHMKVLRKIKREPEMMRDEITHNVLYDSDGEVMFHKSAIENTFM